MRVNEVVSVHDSNPTEIALEKKLEGQHVWTDV